ncbi:hypothetical protein EGY07_19320 [Chryseobacterium indologenes]|nr:hypothetical protein EGY07_19320 [Chryseobacterium indologenes]
MKWLVMSSQMKSRYDALSFDKSMSDEKRKERLQEFFNTTITLFVSNLMTKYNIIDLESKGEIILLTVFKIITK